MNRILVFVAVLVASGAASLAHADALGLGVAGKVSTNGYGIELGYRFNDYLAVRAGINTGSYDYSGTDAGVDYDYTLDFDNYPVMLDWHIFGGEFRVTGGVVSNNNQLTGRASGLIDIGTTTYNTTATTDITFNKVRLMSVSAGVRCLRRNAVWVQLRYRRDDAGLTDGDDHRARCTTSRY